jgi:hypothetical protein
MDLRVAKPKSNSYKNSGKFDRIVSVLGWLQGISISSIMKKIKTIITLIGQ